MNKVDLLNFGRRKTSNQCLLWKYQTTSFLFCQILYANQRQRRRKKQAKTLLPRPKNCVRIWTSSTKSEKLEWRPYWLRERTRSLPVHTRLHQPNWHSEANGRSLEKIVNRSVSVHEMHILILSAVLQLILDILMELSLAATEARPEEAIIFARIPRFSPI